MAAPKPAPDQIKARIEQGFKSLFFNEVTQNLTINGQPQNDRLLNDIFLFCRVWKTSIAKDDVFSVLFSSKIKTMNPIKTYFENLLILHPDTTQDGTVLPELYKFCGAIKSSQPLDGYIYPHISRWAVGIIYQLYGEAINDNLPVLVGPQGRGKTTWARAMCPAVLEDYCAEGGLGGAEKDLKILLTKKLLFLIDEFQGANRKEVEFIKALLSLAEVTERAPYERSHKTLPRIGSLIATTNDTAFLNDSTGNRRLIPIQFDGVDWAVFKKINKERLFAELVYAYKAGFKIYLDEAGINALNAVDSDYRAVSMEEELLLKYFPKWEASAFQSAPFESEWLSATEIMSKISAQSGLGNKLNIKALSQSLSRNGYLKERRGSAYKYAVAVEGSLPTNNEPLPF